MRQIDQQHTRTHLHTKTKQEKEESVHFDFVHLEFSLIVCNIHIQQVAHRDDNRNLVFCCHYCCSSSSSSAAAALAHRKTLSASIYMAQYIFSRIFGYDVIATDVYFHFWRPFFCCWLKFVCVFLDFCIRNWFLFWLFRFVIHILCAYALISLVFSLFHSYNTNRSLFRVHICLFAWLLCKWTEFSAGSQKCVL